MADANMPHVNNTPPQYIASFLKVFSLILTWRQWFKNNLRLRLVIYDPETFWMPIEDSPALTYGEALIQLDLFVLCLV